MSEDVESKITSLDPKERKLARRLRIERRLEISKKRQNDQELEVYFQEEASEQDEIQNQLKKSAEVLEKYLIEGEEYITNIRIANEAREVNRREFEAVNKGIVLHQLDEEATSAKELFATIASKWASIQRQNDPLNINESIAEQKEKCDMLISQKDRIIGMLNEELRKAERQFTKDQKKQMEDINTLTQRIEKQISFMKRAYREELNILEKVVNQEREVLIETSDRNWEELFKKREHQEISNMNKKFEQMEEFNQRMDELRLDFQEHYRETKIKLENDIEELLRELENIKALALLNGEKLDYNYQILKKREDENIIIKSQQKRRINKLQDVINALRKQIGDYNSSMSNQIKKLSENIRKLQKSILDVEAKADHFAHINDEKFHMLWEMNKTRILGVLKKIMDSDRILYEQQMGLDWDPPQNFIVDKRTLPSYKLAVNNVTVELEMRPDTKGVKMRKSVVSQAVESIPTSPSFLNLTNSQDLNTTYMKLLKHILTRIADKSGFLAEKRLKELLAGYEDNLEQIVRLDNVFTALGVHGASFINMLFKHFLPYTFCPVCQNSIVIPPKDESRDSSGSQMSSILSRFGDETFFIPELEGLGDIIRQSDNVPGAIISRPDAIEDTAEEPDGMRMMSEYEVVEDIYEEVENANFALDKTKEKVKVLSPRRRISISRLPELYCCQFQHPLVISPVYVLKALREFVASYYTRTLGVSTAGARRQQKRQTISRYLTQHDIKTYWEKFKLNFGEDRVRVWNGLLAGLKKYHQILKDRRSICDQVLKLRKENVELKRLLGNYLDYHELLPDSCITERYLN
ncbi:dynein regulatory complex protein 1 [Euwallacea fornicatus]|uniref:dynein regulatory complex protein 1 n=1 Tax=Euwallacea fornicatus TaxID=995702 RepID=UPI00338E3C04